VTTVNAMQVAASPGDMKCFRTEVAQQLRNHTKIENFFLLPCTLQHWILPDKSEPPSVVQDWKLCKGDYQHRQVAMEMEEQ